MTKFKTTQQVLADLKWVICSPVLIECSTPDVTWVDDQFCRESWVRCRKKIESMEIQDEGLSDYGIEEPSSQKLGAYFEYLIALWFSIDPIYQVLEQNKIIQGETRTLGELDFLIYDKERKKTIHLEVAVKFYLHGLIARQGKAALWEWFGPSLVDRLDKKYAAMQWRQINLPSRIETTVTVDENWGLLKGRLYHHEPYCEPYAISAQSLKGTWYTQSEYCEIYQERDALLLDKLQWLIHEKPLDEMAKKIDLTSPVKEPVMIRRKDETHCFIVPNDWPENAQKLHEGMRRELEEHYQNAIYEVDYQETKYVLYTSELGPETLPDCCIVTAYNPGKDRPSIVENDRRHNQLYDMLVGEGFTVFSARGKSVNELCLHEEASWAVIIKEGAIWQDKIMRLMALFGQRAVLIHQPNQRPLVWWC